MSGSVPGASPAPRPELDLSDTARLADLKRIVEIETPTGNLDQMRLCADALKEIAARLFGDRIKVMEFNTKHGPLLVLKFGTGRPRVALVGHYDGVPKVGAIKQQPFDHKGEGADQIIYGPATYDMKAGIIAQLYGVAEACVANPIKPGEPDPLDGLVIYLNPDEEEGSISTRPYLGLLRKAGLTAAIVYEGTIGGAFKTSRFGGMWPLVNVSSRPPSPSTTADGEYSYVTVSVQGKNGHPAEVRNFGNALLQSARDIVTACAEVKGVEAINLSVPEQTSNRTPGLATYTLRCPVGSEGEINKLLQRPTAHDSGVNERMVSWRHMAPQGDSLNRAALLQVADDIVYASKLTVAGRRHVTPTMVIPQDDGSITWVPDCRSADDVVRRHLLKELNRHRTRDGVQRSLAGPDDRDLSLFHNRQNVPPFAEKNSRRLFKLVRQIMPGAKRMKAAGGSDASHLADLRVEVIDGAGPDGDGDHGPNERVVGGLERSVKFTAKILLPALNLARQLAVEQSIPTAGTPGLGL